jgi:hypothetical protein
MSFLNPFFLLGGIAVAVPVLLHLIRRDNARKVEFPTLMFLRKIDKKTIRYQKLRHLLLLLLRILAILAIVFAFTRPYGKMAPAAASMVGISTSTHIIALDNSMSMQYQDRWSRAKAAATDIVRQAGEADRFALLEFSDRTSILAALTSDKASVLAAIEHAAEPGDQSTRYSQALRVAERTALESGNENRIIHLISDFQKNGWKDEGDAFRLGAGIELRTVDLGSDLFSNLAIRNVRTFTQDQGGGQTMSVRASVEELGQAAHNEVAARLILDDRVFAEKTLAVPEAAAAEVEFQIPDLSRGEHSVILEIDDASLRQDNRFYMTVDARGNIPVTVVDNRAESGRGAARFFLTQALTVGGLSHYRIESTPPANPDPSGRLLIWNDLPAGDSAVQKRLEAFVNNGGGMLLVLGGTTRASEFNRSFGTWLPVRMDETTYGRRVGKGETADSFVLMTDIRTDHPIFEPFAKPHSGSFSSARFFGYAPVTAGPGAEVLARFDNGAPALIATARDKGRILIFTSSADDSENDLPLKAVYAPFWQQMMHYLERFGEQRNWIEIGDVIDPNRILSEKVFRRGEAAESADEAIALLDPQKQRLELAPGARSIFTEKAGFYDIRTVGWNSRVAVNTVPAESDLTHGNAEEMASAHLSSQPAVLPADSVSAGEEKDRSRKFWVILFLAALLFLFSELFLSNSASTGARDEDRKIAALNS